MNREVLNSKKEMILEFVNSKSYKPMSTAEPLFTRKFKPEF